MFQRSSSTPIRPVSFIKEPQITTYQQAWTPGPLSSPTILPFELGSTIEDPVRGSSYKLIQPLGNGSYAVVYMVLNKKDNQYYALKCLSKANLTDYHLAIQHNEVILHERLSGHPNLVTLHHTFETPEWLFLVMEYCEGQDLYFWLTQNHDTVDLKTGQQLSERERLGIVKQVFTQILEAVGYCHSNGIAHRDLKPENFIVTVGNTCTDVKVKLTDFGLATDEIESVDFDCGSKPYMSFECRNPVRESYHPRLADIWSLGIIFLNLIYHRSPWSDPNTQSCKSFAAFQYDKIDFLIHRFGNMPENVASFLANRVFCLPEEGRVSIMEWKAWCTNLVSKMLEEEYDNEDVIDLPNLSSSIDTSDSDETTRNSQKQHGYTRKHSWSDFFEDSNDNEMDFTAPVIFTDDENSRRASSFCQLEDTNAEVKSVETEVAFFPEDNGNKDIDDHQNSDSSANNSDADSGFGTDEDGNGAIMRRVRAQERGHGHDSSHPGNTTVSGSPPKVIYCRPKAWDEHKERRQQCKASNIESSSPPNNHWNSYNQRRERLEQRRKEKEEKKLDMLAQNRRRGSSVGEDALPRFMANSYPRRVRNRDPSRPSENRVFYFNNNVTPPTTSKKLPPLYLLKPRQSNIKIVSDNTVSSVATSSKPTNLARPAQRKISLEDLSPAPQKSPKKVARSTKTNLSKMLEKMVVFNRGVRIGGQGVEN